ncbi:MAG: ATP phosphoribosyltransferase [Lachnospiraceae bacterium]|nr:ATP phosphoribosyltransferase [Lachnospiraceae bacterium]
MKEYLTVALTKGRLVSDALSLLEKAGCAEKGIFDRNSRKLIFTDETHKMRFFLSKAQDVPTYVEAGAADLGVVGADTVLEEKRRVYEVLDLRFGACRMCVCGAPSAKKLLDARSIVRVATKYPAIAREYFYNERQQTVDIIKLNGSVELGPMVSLSDVIVDIVETGTTLKENGLEVLAEICPLSARLIVNQVSMQMETERIRSLIGRLKEQVEADD